MQTFGQKVQVGWPQILFILDVCFFVNASHDKVRATNLAANGDGLGE